MVGMKQGSGSTRYFNYAAPLLSGEVGRSCIIPDSILGMDTSRIDNLKYVDNSTVMYVSGNALCFMNVSESGIGKRKFLFDLDCRGIGCFALHPSRNNIAVGELGDSPSIYVYSYPELDLIQVLKKGTTRGYSCMAFSMNQSHFASIGQGPDFFLTIWDWNNAKVELRCRAFSQDVSHVAFSPYDSGCLVTSGTGHIHFWRISKTFTGTKLEGKTGKFGKVSKHWYYYLLCNPPCCLYSRPYFIHPICIVLHKFHKQHAPVLSCYFVISSFVTAA